MRPWPAIGWTTWAASPTSASRVADEAPRDLEAERKGLDPRGEADLAELRGEAKHELPDEFVRVESDERAGVGAALVPDNARLAARQRQDGEGSGGQEMLLGQALVIVLVGDRGDDAGLVVIPAVGRNLGERPELRPRAVGGDRQPGAQRPSVPEAELGRSLARSPGRDRAGDADHAEPVANRRERGDDVGVERHMGERVALARVEMKMGQAHSVAHTAVHDLHLDDRLSLRLDVRPGPDPLEKPPRPLGDRDGAQRRPRRGRSCRIDEGDRGALAERLLDRCRQGEARRRAARDDEIENGNGFGHRRAPRTAAFSSVSPARAIAAGHRAGGAGLHLRVARA